MSPAAPRIVAIEKDRRLFEVLRRRYLGCSCLELIHADALEYLRGHENDWTSWKLVSNLPYSVGSPILVELAMAPLPPERMVVTLQFEVAQRLAARAGQSDYGILTLLVQVRYEPQGWFRIPAGCFYPAPDIDSACITLVRRPEPLLEPEEYPTFQRLVKCGFSQRRKTMAKLLKEEWPAEKVRVAMDQLRLPATIRAEAVELEQFIAMTKVLR